MNKQWMALLLSTGIAVTACPVPAAQMPPAEQIHGEAEETSVPVQHDDSDDRETANEFQSDTEPSQSETDDGAAGNEEENNEAGEEKLDIPAMISCIQEAAALEEIDLSSETVSKFFLASDTYDSLTEEELLEKIREWTLRYLWYRKKREEEGGNMNE